jgi:prophage regulatory protein
MRTVPGAIRSALLRLEAVRGVTGDCKSGFNAKVQKGLMPHPIKIGPRAAALPAYEVEAICAARIAGKSEEQIRALVQQLEADRKVAA